MLDVKIKDLLNQQINKEFYSAYLYLAFSNYFSERNLSGFSNWYRIQAQEERDHAMLFLQYLENNSEIFFVFIFDIRNDGLFHELFDESGFAYPYWSDNA